MFEHHSAVRIILLLDLRFCNFLETRDFESSARGAVGDAKRILGAHGGLFSPFEVRFFAFGGAALDLRSFDLLHDGICISFGVGETLDEGPFSFFSFPSLVFLFLQGFCPADSSLFSLRFCLGVDVDAFFVRESFIAGDGRPVICGVGRDLFLRFLDIRLVDEIEGQDLDFLEIVVVVPEGFELFLSAIEAAPRILVLFRAKITVNVSQRTLC